MKKQNHSRPWAVVGVLAAAASLAIPATDFGQPRDPRDIPTRDSRDVPVRDSRDLPARDSRDLPARDSRDIPARDVRDSRDTGGEWAKPVRYEELPREVKRTLDEERGSREVLGIQHVNQSGKEFYRCTVALRTGERSIRIQPGGALLSVEDVTQSDVAAYKQRGSADDYYRERDARELSRQSYWDRVNADVRATAQNPEKVNLDDIPPQVRATFAREAMGEKVDYVVRYRQDNGVIYQTNIPDAPGKVRMLQVSSDGRLLNTGEFTNSGRAVAGGDRIQTLDVSDLPGGVRKALDRDYSRARVSHVDVATRRGQKVYTLQLDDGGRDRYLVVGEDGRVLSDIADRDYSSRK